MPTKSSLRPSDAGQSDELSSIAHLLAGVPNDAARWDAARRLEIENFRKFHLFFCPSMVELRGRAQAIAEVGRKAFGERLDRRYLGSLSGGEPASLNQILRIEAALKAIANHPDENIREATLVINGGKSTSFLLGKDSVVPSFHWVDKELLAKSRVLLGLSAATLGLIILGPHGLHRTLISSLENGTPDKRSYDYRITQALADRMYFALDLLFALLKRADEMPAFSSLFVSAPNAGPGWGRHTLALPIRSGNQMGPFTRDDRLAVERRAREVADWWPSAAAPESPVMAQRDRGRESQPERPADMAELLTVAADAGVSMDELGSAVARSTNKQVSVPMLFTFKDDEKRITYRSSDGGVKVVTDEPPEGAMWIKVDPQTTLTKAIELYGAGLLGFEKVHRVSRVEVTGLTLRKRVDITIRLLLRKSAVEG